jgi:tricorn protease
MTVTLRSAAALLTALTFPLLASGESKLLRFPDIHGDQVAFVHAGDIYRAHADGGAAVRLTSHAGQELYPKFSPDGAWIAFSAEYNGTRQVYVMPAGGGEPRQLTWYNDVGPMPPRGGTDYRVLDWTPDGRHVVVRANRNPSGERDGRPYLVPVDGGMETPLAIPETGGGMLSPDGSKFVYTPIDREFRAWKRYRGGRAQDVWVYDLSANSSVRLTDSRATDHQPMWVGDTVYFVSDRDYTLNLYAIDPAGGEARRLTDFEDDILWPSAGPQRIVFEKAGGLWRFDPASGEARELPITVVGDFPEARPRWVKPAQFVESYDLSPGGERAVFGARGELFTLPAKDGEPRNISLSPDAREHSVSWSPDGRWIAYLSDQTGEYEIYIRAQDGTGTPRQLTRDGDIWRFAPKWSPDSSKLAFADKKQRLRIVGLDGRLTEVDSSRQEDLTSYTWSPDSRFLAYVKTGASRNSSIWVYALDSGAVSQLTPDETAESDPVFDPKGRWLYFVSNRDYNLSFSAFEFNYLYSNATRLYAAPLAADGPALFRPKSDEVKPASGSGNGKDGADNGKKNGKDENGNGGPVRVRLDVAGFNDRVQPLKAPAGNYTGLAASEDGVFFAATGGGGGNGGATLRYLATEGDKAEDVATGVTGYALSANRKKLLIRQGESFHIVDAKADAKLADGKLALDKWELRIEPRREWRQLFVDGWRTLRDWFYEPAMHGQDWDAIRAKYQPLLAHVNTRADLDYLFSEIAGEANAGHVYVESGDQTTVERKAGGLLGAQIEAHESGYFRIARIFPESAADTAARSPLAEPGVDAGNGDFILSVDGVSTRTVDNFYALLENKANTVVTLRLNARPSEEGARQVRVRTVASEQSLRYADWVNGNRAMVEELSGGRIGYIHVPNTSTDGNRELYRGLIAYGHMDALIIDDRYNGGGFIPDRMIEWLSREPLNYWVRRGLEPNPTPLLHHQGPKAMLINGLSSSGGDALPYYFRKLGLGPLIGTRTWGGLIGISGNPRLADNGAILAATFRFLDTEGNWAVENEGVAPDIEVIDRPELIAAGRDPSIEKAVEVLLSELKSRPPAPVTAPPPPSVFPPAVD